MDESTRKAYATRAEDYSADWLAQPEPVDMYALFKEHFVQGGNTVDIGCGNGGDAAWLAAHGFPTKAYDSSAELIAIAKRLYPQISFAVAALPKLEQVTEVFDNVVCETVIMHLPKDEVEAAIARLQSPLKLRGVLYLSWRVTEKDDVRHQDGRLI
jgi:2-polyprenyl-3-methyl-5-hydroxy-6-metoxy-1,4-benzoquinol methylase